MDSIGILYIRIGTFEFKIFKDFEMRKNWYWIQIEI